MMEHGKIQMSARGKAWKKIFAVLLKEGYQVSGVMEDGIISITYSTKWQAPDPEPQKWPEKAAEPEKPVKAAELPEEIEKAAEPVETVKAAEPEKPEETPKKRVKVDVDKVRSLRQAGWSLQKIADEFGVSGQTISNMIVKYVKTHPDD